MDLSNRVAVITGGGSGIGRAVAAGMARRDVTAVALVDVSEAVEDVAEKLNAEAGRTFAIPFQGDTTDEKFRASVFDAISRKYGRVSLCVPAAGITRDDLAVRIDKLTGKARIYPQELFKLVVDVNLIAPVYWSLEMIGRIAEDRAAKGLKRWTPDEGMQGSVVFIGSVSSQGNRGQISYASTKAGIEGAAATIMKEAMFYGVRCSVIHPGFTDTPMVRAMGVDYVAKNILPFTQLGRLIQPDEIADAICFMLASSAVSGELWVDAGWHAPAQRCKVSTPPIIRHRIGCNHDQNQQTRPHHAGLRSGVPRPGRADDCRTRPDGVHHRLGGLGDAPGTVPGQATRVAATRDGACAGHIGVRASCVGRGARIARRELCRRPRSTLRRAGLDAVSVQRLRARLPEQHGPDE